VTSDLQFRSKVTGSSRNVPPFPIVEVWRDGTHSEWLLFLENFLICVFVQAFPRFDSVAIAVLS